MNTVSNPYLLGSHAPVCGPPVATMGGCSRSRTRPNTTRRRCTFSMPVTPAAAPAVVDLPRLVPVGFHGKVGARPALTWSRLRSAPPG